MPLPESITGDRTESPEALIAQLAEQVERKEAALREEMLHKGRRFLGRRAVLDQAPTDTPWSREPRRCLNPRVAGRDQRRRIEALLKLKEFLAAYRTAWQMFREGARDVIFPSGTYALRLHQGVCCGPGC